MPNVYQLISEARFFSTEDDLFRYMKGFYKRLDDLGYRVPKTSTEGLIPHDSTEHGLLGLGNALHEIHAENTDIMRRWLETELFGKDKQEGHKQRTLDIAKYVKSDMTGSAIAKQYNEDRSVQRRFDEHIQLGKNGNLFSQMTLNAARKLAKLPNTCIHCEQPIKGESQGPVNIDELPPFMRICPKRKEDYPHELLPNAHVFNDARVALDVGQRMARKLINRAMSEGILTKNEHGLVVPGRKAVAWLQSIRNVYNFDSKVDRMLYLYFKEQDKQR